MTNNVSELETLTAGVNVLFAKNPEGDVQHLVSPEDDYTACGVGLGDKVHRSVAPGRFDPLCGNCRRVGQGDTKSSDLSSVSRKL